MPFGFGSNHPLNRISFGAQDVEFRCRKGAVHGRHANQFKTDAGECEASINRSINGGDC